MGIIENRCERCGHNYWSKDDHDPFCRGPHSRSAIMKYAAEGDVWAISSLKAQGIVPPTLAANSTPPTARAWKCAACGCSTVTRGITGMRAAFGADFPCSCGRSRMQPCDPASLDLVPSSQLKPIDDDRTLAKRLRATEVALMECKDKLGEKDHQLRDFREALGQVTMERDDALRKAGRR